MRGIVLVFDVCSSTVIVENLVQRDRIDDYVKIVDGFWAFLHTQKDLYKFLGDGFILIFEDRNFIDDIIRFCDELVFYAKQLIIWFKHECLDIVNLPREGITVGIAEGQIRQISSINITSAEFIGRPINVACRLQKAMEKPRHANKVLIHSDLYNRITNRLWKKACVETSRKPHNISGDIETRCYEYDPNVFLESRWEKLRGAQSTTKELTKDPAMLKSLRDQIDAVQKTAMRILAAMKSGTHDRKEAL